MDRNFGDLVKTLALGVALRKESVDRNRAYTMTTTICIAVALRKESVDRNCNDWPDFRLHCRSLSARIAWIEIVRVLAP